MTYEELEEQVNQLAEDVETLKETLDEVNLVGGIGGLSFPLDPDVQLMLDQEILSFIQGNSNQSLTPPLYDTLNANTLSYLQTSTDVQQVLNNNTLSFLQSFLQGRVGQVRLAGRATVYNSNVTPSSIIIFSRQTLGGNLGELYISSQTNGSFIIESYSSSDTSTVNYLII
jgi:hypothetical protein